MVVAGILAVNYEGDVTPSALIMALLTQASPLEGGMAPVWEIAKGVMLFSITTSVGFIGKMLWDMRDMVRDHEVAIYGQHGENGLKRGLKAVTDRVDLIEDRNTAIDAVREAEQRQYDGPERRHEALHQIVKMVADEMERRKTA